MNLAVVGAQWGDEGKGKVVDLLSDRFDVAARFQGGPNAGHTVIIGDERYALNHVPSGVFRPGVRAVIGNGAVIDLDRLLEEIDELAGRGIDLRDRLFVSERAHVILPVLKRLDALSEAQAGTENKIGTTLRGIGPTYEAKAARWGVRMADLADRRALEEHLERILEGPAGLRLRSAGQECPSPAEMADACHVSWGRLAPYVTDTSRLLNDWMDDGSNVLFEGAQGTLLDLDHGSYPFVTSSTTLVGGLCAGLGVAPSRIDGVVGVFKAYGSRVGSGPMPAELEDATGARLRERGKEFGTTTGRPRRCGWFDAVAARYAQRLNRFDAACIMLLDVLDDFEEIRICREYRTADGTGLDALPASARAASAVLPVWETLPGWRTDTTGIRRWEDLPPRALAYLDRLAELCGVEVCLAGVGPERSQTLVRPGSFIEREILRPVAG